MVAGRWYFSLQPQAWQIFGSILEGTELTFLNVQDEGEVCYLKHLLTHHGLLCAILYDRDHAK